MRKLYLVLMIIIVCLQPLPVLAADDTVDKTICKLAVGYQDVDEIKADLLIAVKREVINELFGEMIVASTAVENFVVTSDQIRTSSIGFVRVEGNADFVNGKGFAEVCVTIHAYVTDEDRAKFNPEKLENKYCDADDDLTTAQLIAYVKDESIIQALIEYNPKLKGADKDSLLQLVQKVTYLESDFISDTQTYCATFEGEVVPVEIIAFLETNATSSHVIKNNDECQFVQFEGTAQKLPIVGARMSKGSEYSSGYDVQKIIDNNTGSYWSTSEGAIHNNGIEFTVDESTAIGKIGFYTPDGGASYTQPTKVELVFLDVDDLELHSEVITLVNAQNGWEEHELTQPVCGASMIRLEITQSSRSTASYLTIHEMQIQGWQMEDTK